MIIRLLRPRMTLVPPPPRRSHVLRNTTGVVTDKYGRDEESETDEDEEDEDEEEQEGDEGPRTSPIQSSNNFEGHYDQSVGDSSEDEAKLSGSDGGSGDDEGDIDGRGRSRGSNRKQGQGLRHGSERP